MNPIKPDHYRKGEIDLFEAAYRTRPFPEVRAIMEFTAERYFKRDKNNRLEDIDKGNYVMQRLREYEVLERNKEQADHFFVNNEPVLPDDPTYMPMPPLKE